MSNSIQVKLSVLVCVLFWSFVSFAQTSKKNSVNLGLFYPISNHGTEALQYSNVFSLNIIAGLSGGETGASIAGLANIVKGNVSGFQVAGFLNMYDSALGAQIAGFANFSRGNITGLQSSGFYNNSGNIKGAQIAGFANISKDLTGLQSSGFLNIAGEITTGAQVAGFANLAKDITGAQVAGFINISDTVKTGAQIAGFGNIAKDVKGAQISGFINKADDVEGAQVAGFINVAKNVKGVQIGFVNIADSSDYSIGVINWVKGGEKRIGISTDETLTTLASFRSGGKVLYSIIGVGYNFKNGDDEMYALEGGLGARLINKRQFGLSAEAVALSLSDFDKGYYHRSSLRILPSFKVLDKIEFYAGPTINHVYTNTTEGKGLIKNYIWDETSRGKLNGVYVGVAGGINFVF